MALKDWKRKRQIFHNIPYTWENNKLNGIVEISLKNLDALGNVEGYNVFINDKRLKNQQKTFKTKAKAMKYARAYMKAHPRG